ncbi:hypothetical protein D477_004027 [Arthrobacter crystallopoietes BAB-32]|uniref:SURF1-like protein n=1 Tax=Arthrobacter crystallopoietes BAB-32 TaxID=1246476 RepID=N1V618_9MICC|nr:hypothetical protein D477_004027 [Arthrobacter crystallopoietes BAB-32]
MKTALKPRWIAALVLALAIATVFVLLSQWQFSASRSEAPPPPSQTETVRPLTESFQPGTPMAASEADQMVSFSGRFRPQDQVLVQDRLHEGDNGYWVVTGFAVDGAPQLDGEDVMIPVVRGWIADPADATAAPEGEATVVGRLLPTEAPAAERPVPGQVPTLSVAELINLWDAPSYSGFVTATALTVAGEDLGDGTAGTDLRPVVVGAQPQETPINWMNVFYAVEWVVFAGFAIFLWWRLVADDYRRTLEDEEFAAAEARYQAGQDAGDEQDGASTNAPRNEVSP